ncbi:hypothetical protein [Salinibacter altiplanensis]|uniref:hypothetical protein n=1 Tax=Salinibacter altiplanensis TaxID=1803181 RepID=UPI00131A49EC|nr:hypothetical protein [Salinibacter altiplanensis]
MASVIVPVQDWLEGMEALLCDLLEQEGVVSLEVIVAIEEATGPALPPAQALAESHDRLRVVVAEEAGAEGTGKIANLLAGVS